jgi:cyclophilin family peptidyl-prolyl cis-trans isomerase
MKLAERHQTLHGTTDMQTRIAFSLIIVLFSALPCSAGDTVAAAKPGQKTQEYRRIHEQMNALLAKMEHLRTKHITANEDQRSELQIQWKELIAQGDGLASKLVKAAEEAYAEAPNTDKDITAFLAMLLEEKVRADEFERAAEIGKLLMENKCSEKNVPNLAGIAAFAVSDFDAAEKYLDEAAGQGAYHSAKSKDDKLVHLGWVFLGQVGKYKKLWAQEKVIRDREAKEGHLPHVLLKTSKGDIEFELFENEAPNTVANFISLVERGFYDRDVPFHRVLGNFMAQGGDPTGTGSGGPGYAIACECYQANRRNHFRGSLSMAHAGRDTGGSQFFVTFLPPAEAMLDGKHTVFGRVIRGMDVLAKIQRRDPDDPEAPRPDKIIKATVTRKFHEYKPQMISE